MVQNLPFFVYGTLRRGECRAVCWPHTPQKIVTAITYGRLLHLGDYPGMVPGPHPIAGELWYFNADQIAPTMAILDEIEGFGQTDSDWFTRQIVHCRTVDSGDLLAYAYLYAQYDSQSPPNEIGPDEKGLRDWKKRGTTSFPS